jgi:hypothetical protein
MRTQHVHFPEVDTKARADVRAYGCGELLVSTIPTTARFAFAQDYAITGYPTSIVAGRLRAASRNAVRYER